jgi:hypothetical protein
MKVYQIEDTIIAYFDGRLNDSESAELMHRVSISPEIRDLFEQHQLLRRIAVRAARNVSVSPNVEDAVFANIAALQSKEQRKPVAAFWSMRRGAVAAGLAILLGAGVVATLNSSEPTSVPYAPKDRAVTVTSDIASGHSFATKVQNVDAGPVVHRIVESHPLRQPLTKVATPPAGAEIVEVPISLIADARTVQAEHIQPPTIISHSISDLLVSASGEENRFEIGLSNSSQATAMPGSVAGVPAMRDWALNAAYAFDDHNLAGVRLEEGLFNIQNTVPSSDATYYVGSQSQSWKQTYGLYYEHREYFGRGGFMVAGDVGAGLFGSGNYVTFGLGGRLPIGDHFLAGATISLTRKHDGGPTKDEILSNSSQPVIFEGSDIHNTLITRIEYGLSYRF